MRYFSLYIVFFLFSLNAFSLSRFTHHTIEDGLSNNTVLSVLEDSDGFLWIGTKDGLNCYDSYEYKIYKYGPSGRYSLPDNVIWDILETRQGELLIATEKGIVKYNKDFDRFEPLFENDLADVRKIMEDSNGNIWIGYAETGVKRWDKSSEQLTGFHTDRYGAPDFIFDIYEDSEKNIWISSHNGLFLYRDDRLEPVIGGNAFSGVIELDKDHLLAGNYEKGLCVVGKRSGKIITSDNRYSALFGLINNDKIIAQAFERIGDNIWIGTKNGLYMFSVSKNKLTSYHPMDSKNALGGKEINCLMKNKSGLLWIGFFNAGLDMLDTSKPLFSHIKNSLSESSVYSIFTGGDSVLWIGTDGGGLNKLDKDRRRLQVFKHDPGNVRSLSGDAVISIAEDKTGNLWVGTWGFGLNIMDKITGKCERIDHQSTKYPLPGNNVWHIMKDSRDRMWLATIGGGLMVIKPETAKYKIFRKDDHKESSLPSDICWYIFEDSENRIWVGTQNGLCWLDEKEEKFTVYRNKKNEPASISHNSILFITEDRAGNMWIGTHGGGLNCLDRRTGNFTCFTEEDGLPNNIVNSIGIAEDGNLWVATNNGLCFFNVSERRFYTYSEYHGIQGSQFQIGAYHKGKDGMHYFGGLNGVNVFQDRVMEQAERPFDFVFTDFMILGKSVSDYSGKTPLASQINKAGKVVLTRNDRIVTFRFAAIDFVSNKNYVYSYILEGLDSSWHPVGSMRSVTLTYLPPGNYTFKVKAENGAESRIREIPLVVLPAWWETLPFRLLLTTLFVLSGVAFYLLRMKRMQRINEKLEREVIVRTKELMDKTKKIEDQARKLEKANKAKDKLFSIVAHDLKNPFTALSGHASLLKNNYEKMSEKEKKKEAESIYKSTEKFRTLLVNLLDWSVAQDGNIKCEPGNFPLLPLVKEQIQLLEEMALSKQIDIKVNIAEDLFVFADKNMTEAILRNLLSNALKYTFRGGIISIDACLKNGNKIEITVRDTGIGIKKKDIEYLFDSGNKKSSPGTEQEQGTGLGLVICKEFAEMNGGSISVESEQDEGSIFKVVLPAGNLEKNVRAEESRITDNNETDFPDGSRPLIIVAEDDEEIRSLLQKQLSGKYNVIAVENGSLALERIRKYSPDLVITDLMMPVMDGLSLCKTLKADPAIKAIPVIILTAKEGEQEMIDGFRSGADEYFPKPFNYELLDARIISLLKQKETLEQRIYAEDPLKIRAGELVQEEYSFANQVREKILANITNTEYSVEELSRDLGYSRAQFFRKFKSEFEMAPSVYIRRVRLTYAMELLKQNQYRISEVAFMSGFSDPNHFSKLFAKEFNCTPTEFIRSIQAE
jgi:signal transduction histidine kinase/ligand-binding sensor domain-containing protein/DNA-binding response OmpR family regulator